MKHRFCLAALTISLWFLAGCDSSASVDNDVLQADTTETVSQDSEGLDSSSELPPDTTAPAVPFDWCLPDSPPDKACYASRRDPQSEQVTLARRIADAQMERADAETLKWDWGESVMLWSFTELYQVTGEQKYLDYVQTWMDHHMDAGFAISTSDTCAPAALAVRLFQFTGEEKYREVGERALTYLKEEANRTQDGGISHLGTVSIVTLWVDSLFMFGNVLLAWHEATGDEEALDTFAEQFAIFANDLQDDNGFFRHAAFWLVEPDPPVYWGRGDGWVVAAAYQYLRLRTNRGENDDLVAASAGRLVEAMTATQDASSGLWWTLMDRPDFGYLETSVAALFAYGTARAWRYGQLTDDVLPTMHSAMAGVMERIVDDPGGKPVVTGVSGPTSADVGDEYGDIPQIDNVSFGLGAVILALLETSGLP